MKTIVSGAILIIAGIVVRAHYAPVARLCESPVGGFAQMFSSGAQQNCTEIETLVNVAPWAIGLGALMIVGSILVMLGVIGSAASANRQKRRSTAGQ
jgi:hypothetical protein